MCCELCNHNPSKGSSHSNALRCAQKHHPPDNGGASTRCTLAELQAPLKERLASEKATYDAAVAVRAERKHQRQPVLQYCGCAATARAGGQGLTQ